MYFINFAILNKQQCRICWIKLINHVCRARCHNHGMAMAVGQKEKARTVCTAIFMAWKVFGILWRAGELGIEYLTLYAF